MNKTWIQVNERNRPVCKANDFIKDKTARRAGGFGGCAALIHPTGWAFVAANIGGRSRVDKARRTALRFAQENGARRIHQTPGGVAGSGGCAALIHPTRKLS